MMGLAQIEIPSDSPVRRAWELYEAGEEYANSFKWAAHEEHRNGSMWAAFLAGFQAGMGEFTELMTAEMIPDIYHGDDTDDPAKWRGRWMGQVEKEGLCEVGTPDIRLNPNLFPPGARVLVLVPDCPECGEPTEAPMGELRECSCGFDWVARVSDLYS